MEEKDELISRKATIKAVCDSIPHSCSLDDCSRGCPGVEAVNSVPASSGWAPTEEGGRSLWLTEAQAAAWRALVVQRTLYELDDNETALCISTLERMLEEMEE